MVNETPADVRKLAHEIATDLSPFVEYSIRTVDVIERGLRKALTTRPSSEALQRAREDEETVTVPVPVQVALLIDSAFLPDEEKPGSGEAE